MEGEPSIPFDLVVAAVRQRDVVIPIVLSLYQVTC